MRGLRILRRFKGSLFSKSARTGPPAFLGALWDERGSAVLEFAIALPLLVVFVVGIFDFSGAFNQKQKVAQAAQEGAIVAGAQPTGDIATNSSATPTNPASLQPVVTAIFNSLAGSGVLTSANKGSCGPPPFSASSQTGLAWTYTISGCSGGFPGDNLTIVINRGTVFAAGSVVAIGTTVQVTYPYHWRFNNVIQLLIPGANYAATTQITEIASVHNQL
jgi:Flp pilus assembly protein TadG